MLSRHDPLHARRLRRGDQVARAPAAQLVVDGEVTLDLARVDATGQRRQLVDDRVGRAATTAAFNACAVERVDHHRLRAGRAQRLRPSPASASCR